ncbi:MAG TPA: ribonuclease Y [Clostridia bacterium]|jgi:ribonuclease Y|nr:ribonuclease Y [Clostridiaceae bacterium]HOF26087.1 ribonuclease Y [Clostridia bacterium]HOM34640.1 ribonuclease Y [Clostridia bacterium]HOR89264.1 ribonuclease Y [Clostridia bacterium]HOT70649.1 ribonuclease Y [Clostridia bacterium]
MSLREIIGLVIIAFLIIFSIVMFFLGIRHRKKVAEKEIGSAESEAKKLILQGEKNAEERKREILIEAKEEVHKSRVEMERELKERRKEIQRMESRVIQREEALDKKVASVESKEEILNKKMSDIDSKQKEIEQIHQDKLTELERISALTVEEAKTYLLKTLEDDIKHEKVLLLKEYEAKTKEESENLAKNIISSAIQRCAADYVAENTVSVVELPNDEMKGRIIGREGRNIRALETLTGIDLIIDDTPEAVVLSGFDPIRREVARIALEKLILDGRIHPARIEDTVNKAKKEIENTIKIEGDKVSFEAGVHNLHPEIIRLLGRMKYRTSYGQNVLKHSLEVSLLTGIMAAELGLDVPLAKRAGLLHDIGKSIDFETEGSHIDVGADIARKYNEHPVVLDAIMSHHGDKEPESAIAVLVQAADAISAARPGARRETLEAYVKRIEKLEEIANSFEGVEKSFAVQAGREIRIMIKPEKMDDDDMVLICRDIVKRIENEMEYPGQIKVNVIREVRVVDYAK